MIALRRSRSSNDAPDPVIRAFVRVLEALDARAAGPPGGGSREGARPNPPPPQAQAARAPGAAP
jgi:hypothetical protein